MKIQAINYPVYKKTNIKNNNYKNTLPVFKGSENKTEPANKPNKFFEKLRALFNREFPDLSYEEQISEQISDEADEIILGAKKLEKSAKLYHSLAKNSLIIGREEGFRQYCDFNKSKGEKLVFGEIDPETSYPSTMTHISLPDGMKTIRYYEFYTGLDLYKIQDFSIPDVEDEMMLSGKNMISLKEINYKNRTLQHYVFTREGFYFYEGEIDERKNLKTIHTIFNYNKKDLSKDEYITINQEGKYDVFGYDEEKQMWIKKKTIDKLDISDVEN